MHISAFSFPFRRPAYCIIYWLPDGVLPDFLDVYIYKVSSLYQVIVHLESHQSESSTDLRSSRSPL
jgi:hypothetical protein